MSTTEMSNDVITILDENVGALKNPESQNSDQSDKENIPSVPNSQQSPRKKSLPVSDCTILSQTSQASTIKNSKPSESQNVISQKSVTQGSAVDPDENDQTTVIIIESQTSVTEVPQETVELSNDQNITADVEMVDSNSQPTAIVDAETVDLIEESVFAVRDGGEVLELIDESVERLEITPSQQSCQKRTAQDSGDIDQCEIKKSKSSISE